MSHYHAEQAAKLELTMRMQAEPTEFRGLLCILYEHAMGKQPNPRLNLLKWFFKWYQYANGEWHCIDTGQVTLH